MKPTALLITFLIALAGLSAATWTGSWNTDWNNPSNWNPAFVPTSTDNVIIPNVANKPVVSSTFANCRDLTIQADSRVTISGSYNLIAQNNVIINGQLVMSSTGDLQVGNGLYWESGSTASVTNSSAAIYVGGNVQFASGSNVQMTSGTLHIWGSIASTDLANYSANTQINALNVAKSTGTVFSIRSLGQPFTINGHISNQAGNTFYNYYTGDITLKGNIVDNNSDPTYGIKWDNGTLILDGANPSIGLQSTSCYLKNLTFSQTGTSQLTYPLRLKGNLRIESGVFYPQAHNITLSGNWENLVGPNAFTEGTAMRVTFNGTAHQLVNYTETFNILEVNSGAALRVNSSTAVVTCAQYDWTAGGIDVISGTFTANDLIDNGIYGSYWVNPGGIINLTNNDGWVDLNGNLTFTNGGTINVYGGSVTSDWSYSGNASLTMNGPGILDFKNQGINIYNSATNSFTYSINDYDAEIRTAGNFSCNRSTFNPTHGKVVMYGTTDATLTMNAGTLYELQVDKAVTRESEPQPAVLIMAEKDGTSREVTRANTVNLATNVTVSGSINIDSGVCNLQSYQLNCYRARIYDTLRMTNAAAKLYADNQIIWRETSVADITLGTLETIGSWNAWTGANVMLPVAVVTNLLGTSAKSIDNLSATLQFGTLNIGGTATTGGIYTLTGSQNILVAGNLTIRNGNELDLGTRNLTVNGVLNLNGKLDIHATTATVHGKPYLETTSNLTIDSGSFVCDESAILPRTTTLKGILSINSGTLNLANHYLTVNAGSTNSLASGTIYCDGVNAQNAGTFQPAGGTVVLGNLFGGGTFGLRVSNGNWLPNVSIDAGSQGYFLYTDLIIKGSLTLISGGFDVQDSSPAVHDITISGNWSHQGGTFFPRSGRVIFNGSAHQYVNYTETFNIVEANKAAGSLRVDSAAAVVTIASYDWTAGAVDVLTGTLTMLDLADNGMFGGFYCTPSGTLNITQDASSRIDLNGILQITGGVVNIYGGSVYACWPYAASASLTMTDGTLNYHDQGIYIFNSAHSFSYNLTGGNITTTKGLWCNRPGFNPSGGTFKLIGSTDAVVNFSVTTSSLPFLEIDKPGAAMPTVTLSNDLSCVSGADITSGKLSLNGHTLASGHHVHVSNGGILELTAGSVLTMASGKLLTAYDNAQINAWGTEGSPVIFTRSGDGYYDIYINAGAMITANYARFQYTGITGLGFAYNANVGGLHNCSFLNGQSGGAYLRFQNQDATITNAYFPDSNGYKNVIRSYNVPGTINLVNATGSFAGPAFEHDPYNSVFWTGSAADLQIEDVAWNRPDDYVCAPVTATVTVINSGIHDIITPFRIDFYRNSLSIPAAGILGDQFITIPALNAGAEAVVTFDIVSTDVPGTWTSWFRVDTNNLISETNEGNNITSANVVQWLPLPSIPNLSIELMSDTALRLSWTYPITVDRYKMYRSTEPYFTPGAGSYWGTTVNTTAVTGTLASPRYFYFITAERDLP